MATHAETDERRLVGLPDNRLAVAAADVTRRHGEGEVAVDALRGVSLSIEDGELVGVMGPFGSGKSTLLHILAGLEIDFRGVPSAAEYGLPLKGLRDGVVVAG